MRRKKRLGVAEKKNRRRDLGSTASSGPFWLFRSHPYLRHMFELCLPTRSTSVPSSSDWLHEVKYDGYRLRLERDGDRVRLITRGGYNRTDRYIR